jgi:antitoxin VapB
MKPVKIAKLFKSGRSQAVRLPKEFRFEGTEVQVRKVGNGVMLEPVNRGWAEIFAEIDKNSDGKFMIDGRDQPPMPPDDDRDPIL